MSTFPDDCIQSITPGQWWARKENRDLEFGDLIFLAVPFFDCIPYRLKAQRSDPTDHSKATVIAEPLRRNSSGDESSPLPVAGLPNLDGAHGWINTAECRN